MIEINLLPREFRKKPVSLSFGKTGLYGIAGVAGVLLMLAAITVYQIQQINALDSNIRKATQRAVMLQKDIQLVDALLDVKAKIHERMSAVEQLDSHRSTWVRVLANLSSNVPEFVWLGHFMEKPIEKPAAQANQTGKQKNQQPGTQTAPTKDTAVRATPWVRKAEVEGYAFTLNALASFMINMMRSDYFDDVELISSDEVKFQDEKAYNFVLSCNLHYLSDEELRQLIAQAADEKTEQQSSTGHRGLN